MNIVITIVEKNIAVKTSQFDTYYIGKLDNNIKNCKS